MENAFVLPTDLIGRFAVVKLWPEIKTAEDECIARLKLTAAHLGLECIEVNANGSTLSHPQEIVSRENVDFVLHLHYDTPKFYDAYSIVALWNPLQFYHEWGYARTSRNLITHDDFVSCSSPSADDHVSRMIRTEATHLPPFFNLYHSVPDNIHPPSLGDHKLFYAGINWEAISGGKSRHQEVLKILDSGNDLRIYGPHIFQGVKVWSDYKSYVREIPFDGISMINEISKAGIALVLSSQAHKKAELMSNRLFESVAAGALVICDENPFAKKFFGDSLLYIDTRCAVETIHNDIKAHLAWASANAEKALEKISKAQDILRKNFTLTKNLKEIYLGLRKRQADISVRQTPSGQKTPIVGLCFLLPEYSADVVRQHIKSLVNQDYKNIIPVFVIEKSMAREEKFDISTALAGQEVSISLMEVDFLNPAVDLESKIRRPLGNVIDELLENLSSIDAVTIVAPNESLLSNHISVQASALMRNPETDCVATAMVVWHPEAPVHGIQERIDFTYLDPAKPNGYARFIFRISGIPVDRKLALRYLDRKALAVLIGGKRIRQVIPSTVLSDISQEFPTGLWDEGQENELLGDYCPAVFNVLNGFTNIPPVNERANLTHQFQTSASVVARKLLSWRWLSAQFYALRRDGFKKRLAAFKRKFRI